MKTLAVMVRKTQFRRGKLFSKRIDSYSSKEDLKSDVRAAVKAWKSIFGEVHGFAKQSLRKKFSNMYEGNTILNMWCDISIGDSEVWVVDRVKRQW